MDEALGEARDGLAAPVRQRKDVPPDRLAGKAGRVGSAERRADRASGDRDRPHAEFVERFHDDDVGKAARAAAAERERKRGRRGRRHLAPAARANSQAFAAIGRTICARVGANSLVAVPSRTRPTMPWMIAVMRKKL